MTKEIMEAYERWCREAKKDDMAEKLAAMAGREDEITDSFYTSLEFGTAGLRGILGAGTNRMNVYTVGQAAEGLARYTEKHFASGERIIVLSYDSRHKSELFARQSAVIFARHGIHAYIYPVLMPTPCLSFAVRYLHAAAGVMVTASHNPAQYNGYKVYGPDGSQMTSKGANEVYDFIQHLDLFNDVPDGDFDELVREGKITFIGEDLISAYVAEVKKQSCLQEGQELNKDVAIVYTPLYGTGMVPVTRVLKECGYTHITVVEEQKNPDGDFPTCPYPNPEIPATMALGIDYCKKCGADLLIATDPDADRCAIAVKDENGDYPIISGNETGVLLLDYIASMRRKNGTLPENPVAVKSIVTTDLAAAVASDYGVELRNVLTGFKYIGEQILLLEEEQHPERFIFGYEESCGFLSGTYARDKDAVNAALLISEMFCYYKQQGKSLLERLKEICEKHGYYCNKVHSYEFDGISGKDRMKEISRFFREEVHTIGDRKVIEKKDYLTGIDGLPKADVLKLILDDQSSVIVRPSGTEPKMKLYNTTTGKTKAEAIAKEEKLQSFLDGYMK